MTAKQAFIAGVAAAALLAILGWGAWLLMVDSTSTARIQSTIVTSPASAAGPAAADTARPATPAVAVIDAAMPDLAPTTQKATGVGQALYARLRGLRLAEDEVAFPLVESLTIRHDSPDAQYRPEISPRTMENFGLMMFDLSRLTEVPTKAVLKASVHHMENTGGFHTPARLAFYRMKTPWDASATYHYASARRENEWKAGFAFDPRSDADFDPARLAVVLIPNPPTPTFTIDIDITPLVAGWVKKEHPNCGILVSTIPGKGYSYQANIVTRKLTASFQPQIVCTVSAAQKQALRPSTRPSDTQPVSP